jgi:hypothetical protein
MTVENIGVMVCAILLAGLIMFRVRGAGANAIENFAGLNYPMSYKINREVYLPPTRCGDPPEMFSVSGNYQSSLPPRFGNTQFRSRIRCAGLPDTGKLPFDPDHPITHRAFIGSADCGKGKSKCRKPPLVTLDGPPCAPGCAPPPKEEDPGCCLNDSDKNIYHALPVTDMRTLNHLIGQQEAHKQERILEAVMGTAGSSCQDAAAAPIVYDRLIYANARSRLRKGGTDWIRGDLPIVPVLPEANPESLIWGRPSVTPHIDLNRGAMHVLGGMDNHTQLQLQDLMNASVNGTLSTFSGVPLRNEAVTCDGKSSDIIVNSFPAP